MQDMAQRRGRVTYSKARCKRSKGIQSRVALGYRDLTSTLYPLVLLQRLQLLVTYTGYLLLVTLLLVTYTDFVAVWAGHNCSCPSTGQNSLLSTGCRLQDYSGFQFVAAFERDASILNHQYHCSQELTFPDVPHATTGKASGWGGVTVNRFIPQAGN